MEVKREDVFLIDDDLFWSTEDIPAYEYLKKSHEHEERVLSKHLEGTNVAVQAGGHCGFVIRELLNIGFTNIYTFEPNNSMFLALCLNVPEPSVYKIQGCVGDEVGLVNMIKNGNRPAGANFVDINTVGLGLIPTFTIDSLALNSCDLIMLDTEGYEYKALLGAKKTIEKYKPLLCLERCWGPEHINVSEVEMDSLLDLWGYVLVDRAGESDHIYKYKV